MGCDDSLGSAEVSHVDHGGIIQRVLRLMVINIDKELENVRNHIDRCACANGDRRFSDLASQSWLGLRPYRRVRAYFAHFAHFAAAWAVMRHSVR